MRAWGPFSGVRSAIAILSQKWLFYALALAKKTRISHSHNVFMLFHGHTSCQKLFDGVNCTIKIKSPLKKYENFDCTQKLFCKFTHMRETCVRPKIEIRGCACELKIRCNSHFANWSKNPSNSYFRNYVVVGSGEPNDFTQSSSFNHLQICRDFCYILPLHLAPIIINWCDTKEELMEKQK